MISGPGVVSPSASRRSSASRSASGARARPLHDIRQHGVGAAEGEERRLGEEPGHRQRRLALRRREQASGAAQSARPVATTLATRVPRKRARAVASACRRRSRPVPRAPRWPRAPGRAAAAAAQAPDPHAGERRDRGDDRERDRRHHRDERSPGDRPRGRRLQGPAAESMRRLHDDRDHRRLDGGEGAAPPAAPNAT